ncbi:hypothetical protein E8E12_010776 [Didymella heteroderae]|uniref:Uncharacterized protein n=1 Tax=Didymella heteroderae TaxID=1769908 RepID=A0A9P4X0Z9_9PLEO|nr:hypothetical protein E8E12_010776 [Didymella heteroderae]
MLATNHHVTEHFALAEMAASAISTEKTDVPFCPPPCQCADCETYYYTLEQQKLDRFHYYEVFTDEQAKVVIANYISKIDSARAYLQQSVQQHGDLLLDRWRKRNPKKRTALLLDAEPDLPAKKGHGAEVQAKDAPADWAPYDHEQLRTPWELGLLDTAFTKGAVVMFGPRFGAYTFWQKESADRFDIVGFPRAKLVLEAQATLLGFLQRVVEQLLAGGVQLDGSATPGCSRWNANVEGGMRMTGDAAVWSNFVQTPFTGPPRFDVDALVALVQARVTATGDHLGLLRTEPPYFRLYMQKLYQMQAVEKVREKHIAMTILTWELIEELQGEPDSHTRFRYAMLLDMLDDHLANPTSEERARLDEILRVQKTEDRIYWRTAKTAKSAQNPDITKSVKALKAFRATNAPAGPRNIERLQQFDRTHEALQAFWRELATAQQEVYKKNGFSEADMEYSMESLQMWNGAEYTARLIQKREQLEADVQKSRIVGSDVVFLPLPSASSSSSKLDTVPQVKVKLKLKLKTRGPPQIEGLEEAAHQQEAFAIPVKTIQLSKSPYITLRCMFPGTVEERQKDDDWSVFVNSMNEAGFIARNGGGSIVRFESRDGDGSINFRRPHPNSTIDPTMLQATGWRMNKWFGWVRETFILAKK